MRKGGEDDSSRPQSPTERKLESTVGPWGVGQAPCPVGCEALYRGWHQTAWLIFSGKFTSPSVGGDASICQPVLAEYKPASSPILGVTYAGCKHKCICPHSDSGRRAPNAERSGKAAENLPKRPPPCGQMNTSGLNC